MFDEPCKCGHPRMDHCYPLTPWWKFWKFNYRVGECMQSACREPFHVMATSGFYLKCPKFKLDNLSYIEQLAKERGLV